MINNEPQTSKPVSAFIMSNVVCNEVTNKKMLKDHDVGTATAFKKKLDAKIRLENPQV